MKWAGGKMKLLDFLYNKKRKSGNDFFGKMTLIEFEKEKNNSYFECRRHFKPTNTIIEIRINGDELGVTEKQIEFFKQVEDNYLAICKSVTPLVKRLFDGLKIEIKIVEFEKEFQATRLYLPVCDTVPVVWEISFETRLETKKYQFTVLMKEFEAKEIGMD